MTRNIDARPSTSRPALAPPEDALLRAVREAASGEYDVLGEMGRGEGDTIVYLARELATERLVALRLRPEGAEYELTVQRELDASVPATGSRCPECRAELAGWGRYCARCGHDVSGLAREQAPADRAELLRAVRDAASGEYEVLGEMERSEGGGVVYFAREPLTGRLVALRLQRDGSATAGEPETYTLGVTQVMQPLLASLGTTHAEDGPAVTQPRRAAAQAPASAPPLPVTPEVAPPAPSLATEGGALPAPRATPEGVLAPQEAPVAEDPTPPRPPEQRPVRAVAVLGGLVVVAVSVGLFVRSRGSAADATRSPAAETTATAPATPLPSPVARAESGYVRIGALPHGATITIDGKSVAGRGVALTPGMHLLGATAPGRTRASERANIAAGDTFVWTPTLASAAPRPSAKPAKSVAAKPPTPAPAAPTCGSAYFDKQWDVALATCRAEADAGSASAQRNLGVMYAQGFGVAKDDAQAVSWFRKAADAGNRDAIYQLATMYEEGRGTARNPGEAASLYRKGALLGDPDAQYRLARMYDEGRGVSKDLAEAATWYRKSAEQGNSAALNRLGWMLADGKGVRKDEREAVQMFQAAAENGDAEGEFNLAYMYAKGRGIPKSDSIANEWFRKSAGQGYPDALREMKRRRIVP